MIKKEPTASEIRTANRNAVGGSRKRCRKGKNCSATCIDGGKYCLVGLPEPASQATTKVASMLQQRQKPAPPIKRGPQGQPSPGAAPTESPGKPYEVAVTQGRFNIPHLGHVKMIQEMLEKADKAHVLIGKGKDNVDQDLRSQFLRAALRHAGVDLSRVELVKQESMMPYASALGAKHGSKKAIAVLGEDQDKFLQAVNKAAKVDTHLVPRAEGGASSTKIRQMIDSRDMAGLKKAYNNDPYLVRLAIAAHSVEKNPEKWGVEAKPAAKSKSKSAAPKETEQGGKEPPKKKAAPPVKKEPPAPPVKKATQPQPEQQTKPTPAIDPILALQKIGDDNKLKSLQRDEEFYKKEWADTIGKGDPKKTMALGKTYQFAKAQLAAFQKEYDDKYNRPVALTPRETLTQESKRVRDRIQDRLEEGIKFYKPEQKAPIIALREEQYKAFKKLSDDELGSLGLYGENKNKYYRDVNKFLRTGSMEGIPAERQQIVQNIVSNMNSALGKLPASEQTQFSRAVSGGGARNLANLKVGDVIEDKGFGSYTLRDKVTTLDQFFRSGQDNALMQVTSRNARNVAPVMEFQRESEHILRPNSRLRVVQILQPDEPGAHRSRAVGSMPTYIFEEVE